MPIKCEIMDITEEVRIFYGERFRKLVCILG